jgi:hypothetical protein
MTAVDHPIDHDMNIALVTLCKGYLSDSALDRAADVVFIVRDLLCCEILRELRPGRKENHA